MVWGKLECQVLLCGRLLPLDPLNDFFLQLQSFASSTRNKSFWSTLVPSGSTTLRAAGGWCRCCFSGACWHCNAAPVLKRPLPMATCRLLTVVCCTLKFITPVPLSCLRARFFIFHYSSKYLYTQCFIHCIANATTARFACRPPSV